HLLQPSNSETPYPSRSSSNSNLLGPVSSQVSAQSLTNQASPTHSLYSSKQYSLSPDPQTWGSEIWPDAKEADDDLHDPSGISHRIDRAGSVVSCRALCNFGCLIVLVVCLITLL